MRLRKPMRVVLLVALAATPFALAPACGTTTDDAQHGDASTDAPIADAADTADASDATDGADAAIEPGAFCPPLDATPPPPMLPPVRHRDACLSDLTALEVVRCLLADPGASPCPPDPLPPEWDDCVACIFGDAFARDGGSDRDAEPDWATPIVVEQGVARLNVGACLVLNGQERIEAGIAPTEGDSGCAARYIQSLACEANACAPCAPRGQAAYEDCRTLADETYCRPVAVKSSCGLELADASCAVTANFVSSALVYAKRFCTLGDK